MVSEQEYVNWLVQEANRRPLNTQEREKLSDYYFKNPAAVRQVRSHIPKAYRALLLAVPLASGDRALMAQRVVWVWLDSIQRP